MLVMPNGAGGTLKEGWGRGVPQQPLISDPLKTKIVHFATPFETRDLVFLIHFVSHTLN